LNWIEWNSIFSLFLGISDFSKISFRM
jgi:hypothetical protein